MLSSQEIGLYKSILSDISFKEWLLQKKKIIACCAIAKDFGRNT